MVTNREKRLRCNIAFFLAYVELESFPDFSLVLPLSLWEKVLCDFSTIKSLLKNPPGTNYTDYNNNFKMIDQLEHTFLS